VTAREKTYLGDSVYAAVDAAGCVVLTTENGLGPSNTIVLEPEVLIALWHWVPHALSDGTEAVTTHGPYPKGKGPRMTPDRPTCELCGAFMTLHFWDRPGGAPGNGWSCDACMPLAR
jgi:hypothetical protein